jgi:hypothetical protein
VARRRHQRQWRCAALAARRALSPPGEPERRRSAPSWPGCLSSSVVHGCLPPFSGASVPSDRHSRPLHTGSRTRRHRDAAVCWAARAVICLACILCGDVGFPVSRVHPHAWQEMRSVPSMGTVLAHSPGKKERKTYARCQAFVKGALASKSHRARPFSRPQRAELSAAPAGCCASWACPGRPGPWPSLALWRASPATCRC